MSTPPRSLRHHVRHVHLAPPLCRAAFHAIVGFGLITAVPAQIVFTGPSCYANGGDAPLALALDDTTGTGAPLSLVSAHVWPLPPFPTGVDSWGPPALGVCPTFGPVTPLVFSGTAPAWPVDSVIDVAAAGPQGRFALVFDPAFVASYVEGWPATPAKNPLPPFSNPRQLIAVDFDGDDSHLVDLLVLDTTGAVYLAVQGPAGIFSPFAALPAPPAPFACTAARFASGSFDNDNLPDVVITWGGLTPQVQVMRNVVGTSLVLASTTPLGPGFNPGLITVGDFAPNGVDDFVVADGGLGGGTGAAFVCTTGRAFPWPALITVTPTPLTLPLGTPSALTHGDYDLDGDIDLAYAHSDGLLHFLPNAGNGTFPNSGVHAEVTYAIIGSITDIETGDIDGDGDLDVATCAWGPGGGSCVWCNALPPGHCQHEFRGGDDTDAFVGVDCACPRTPLGTLLAPLRQFDDATLTTNFAHTFAGLPNRICSAKLTISWLTPITGDHLLLDLATPANNFALDYVEKTGLVTLDLARLPGGQNLLPQLNRVGYLDVGGAYASQIDFMRLDIITYCEHDVPAIDYWHTNIRTPGVLNFTITGGALYASGIGVVVIGGGVGCPNAPFPYDGLCLLPGYDIILLTLLDGSGVGTLSVPLPVLPCCLQLNSQAVAIKNTFAPPFGWSKTISDYTK